jgi:hypothetical protein
MRLLGCTANGRSGDIRRRISGIPLIAVLALSFTSVLLVSAPSVQLAHAESLGSWTATAVYPVAITNEACAISEGYIYCVAGDVGVGGGAMPLNATYYAPVSSSGVGAWTATTDYPLSRSATASCGISGGYIYCVGNYPGSANASAVYFAPVSSSGVGTWMNTTRFPSVIPNDYVNGPKGCVTAQGYIYCIGSATASGGAPAPAPVFFAALSSSGVGEWARTTTYPTAGSDESCATTGDYVYCVEDGSVYYAPILSSGKGLGEWSSAPYAVDDASDQSCTISGGYLYCVGGIDRSEGQFQPMNAVYYAQVLSSSQGGGLSDWTDASNYPIGIQALSCVSVGGYVYCVGGDVANYHGSTLTSAVYYTSSSSQLPSTSELTVHTQTQLGTPFLSDVSGLRVLLYDQAGNLVSTGFSPATFTVDSGQTYTVRVDDYGACQFYRWLGSNDTSPSSTPLTIAGNVSIVALYSVEPTSYPPCGRGSGVYVDSLGNGRLISGYDMVLYDSNGTKVASAFTITDVVNGSSVYPPPYTFHTAMGQTYLLQADSYGNCTFDGWNDGATSNPRAFNATYDQLMFTALYDCTGTSTSVNVSTVDFGGPLSGYYATLWQNATIASFVPSRIPGACA